MKVIITPAAETDLKEIWSWNARDRGIHHADGYLAFLDKHIHGLSKTYAKGRLVSTRPNYRYILMKRRARGHGHIAVYEVLDNTVSVLHVYHTAQDWQTKLSDEN